MTMFWKGFGAKAVMAACIAWYCAMPTSACAGSATYMYDALGRVSQINYDYGVVLKYSYDAAGNRSMEVVTGTGILSPELKAALLALLSILLLND